MWGNVFVLCGFPGPFRFFCYFGEPKAVFEKVARFILYMSVLGWRVMLLILLAKIVVTGNAIENAVYSQVLNAALRYIMKQVPSAINKPSPGEIEGRITQYAETSYLLEGLQ
jgi:hypothetical protein